MYNSSKSTSNTIVSHNNSSSRCITYIVVHWVDTSLYVVCIDLMHQINILLYFYALSRFDTLLYVWCIKLIHRINSLLYVWCIELILCIAIYVMNWAHASNQYITICVMYWFDASNKCITMCVMNWFDAPNEYITMRVMYGVKAKSMHYYVWCIELMHQINTLQWFHRYIHSKVGLNDNDLYHDIIYSQAWYLEFLCHNYFIIIFDIIYFHFLIILPVYNLN